MATANSPAVSSSNYSNNIAQASPAPNIPTNLQAPYVVNQMPLQQPTSQQTYGITNNPTLQAPYVVNNAIAAASNPSNNMQQYTNNVASSSSSSSIAANTPQFSTQYTSSNTQHPGYNFNQQTGTFEYASGYHHQNINSQNQFYGQYTSASGGQSPMQNVGTTNSASANKMNVATGFNVGKICYCFLYIFLYNPFYYYRHHQQQQQI